MSLIPTNYVATTTRDELKELGGNAIVFTCPMSNTHKSLTEKSVSCSDEEPVVTFSWTPVGKTEVGEISVCPELLSQVTSGLVEPQAKAIAQAFRAIVLPWAGWHAVEIWNPGA